MQNTGTDSPVSALKAELDKVRNLPKGKRWEYIWEYYRLVFFGIAFSVFFLWMLITFLVNGILGTLFPKDPISIAFASTDFVNCETWMEECRTAIGYDDREEALKVMATSPYNTTTDDFRITTTVWFANGQPDIFIVDAPSYQYLQELGVLVNLQEVWPDPLRKLSENWMDSAYGLEISDTGFARAYNLSDQPVYLCMVVSGAGLTRAQDIVTYILTDN